nr:anti-repressor Ant [uncultured phage]
MNNIQIFQNEQFGQVRIAMNESNEPLFCLSDVCNVIGISNSRNVKARLDAEDVRQMDTLTEGGNQQATFVTESGLYDVIIRSDSEKAKPFRKWVTNEVLPSIRKHGGYIASKQDDTPEEIMARALLVAQETLKRKEQRLIEAEQKIQKDAPKVLFADAVSTSQRSCLIAELAKILQQNGVNIGQNRLFSWMRENGYLCQKGEYYNQPTQKAMKLGLFELKKTSITKPDGSVLVTTTTKVSGKGQIYFIEKFLSKEKPFLRKEREDDTTGIKVKPGKIIGAYEGIFVDGYVTFGNLSKK